MLLSYNDHTCIISSYDYCIDSVYFHPLPENHKNILEVHQIMKYNNLSLIKKAPAIYRCLTKNDQVVFGRSKNNTQLWGAGTPHSLRRRGSAYTMRFDLKPEVIIHKLRLFRKSCITFVWLDEHCVGHLNACTVFSCFLHPSRGGAYTQEVYHENLRIYRPQAERPGLPGIG